MRMNSLKVTVDAVLYFRLFDPTRAVTNVNDAFSSTKLLAQTTFRNVLGVKTLAEMLSDRHGIATLTQKELDRSQCKTQVPFQHKILLQPPPSGA